MVDTRIGQAIGEGAKAIGQLFTAFGNAEEPAAPAGGNNNNVPNVEPPKAEQPIAEQPKVEAAKALDANNEFLTISSEFVSVDLKNFTEKYPLISTIAMIATGFFALMHVFSFSPVSIVTGLFLGMLCVSLAKSIWGVHRFAIFSKVWTRAMQSFSSNPAPAQPAQPAPAVQPQVNVVLKPEQKV